ncbi:MAG: hypothetical protein IJ721_04210 [Bacteroidales bacterium]|nr:hypothetical protein [Bacteroidales bacterium]
MADRTSFLYSGYIIDGISQPLAPADLLQECSREGALPPVPEGPLDVIADETVDLAPDAFKYREEDIDRYAAAVARYGKRSLPIPFAAPYTCGKAAQALIDALWMGGHFRLGDLDLKAGWHWDGTEIGRMAAFYASVEAASTYIDALGLKFHEVRTGTGPCAVSFKAVTGEETEGEEEEVLIQEPFKTACPRLSRRRRCPAGILSEASDWLIYIPFDTCDFRLGGSLLAAATGTRPTTALDIGDADYFIDCYEVVRELVEDGIVKAGATVLDGGLLHTLQKMAGTCGASISIGAISRAYGGELPVRILFGEVPGAIIQIADGDYDYVDAELLLQDIAYFPLGHPVPDSGIISVLSGENAGLPGILESLLNTREGED